MKSLLASCVIGLAACAAAPKPVPKTIPKAERPVSRAVSAHVDDRRVSFTVGGLWEPSPQGKGDILVLQHADSRDSAIAVFFEKADISSTIEDVTMRWMGVMVSRPMVFTPTDVSVPVFSSDEAATFTVSGDVKGTPMVSKCQIKLIGDVTSDYWVIIFSVSPSTRQEEAFAEVDRIAKSIRLVPPVTP